MLQVLNNPCTPSSNNKACLINLHYLVRSFVSHEGPSFANSERDF